MNIPFSVSSVGTLGQTHFWSWAKDQSREDVTVANYHKCLTEAGITGLDRDTMESIRFAVILFCTTQPHMPGIHRLRSLFKKAESGYLVQGYGNVRYEPSKRLLTALRNAGWIYAINPSTTYFVYIPETKVLWAKYQTIIGQRPLARIGERNVQTDS